MGKSKVIQIGQTSIQPIGNIVTKDHVVIGGIVTNTCSSLEFLNWQKIFINKNKKKLIMNDEISDLTTQITTISFNISVLQEAKLLSSKMNNLYLD
jgi:hypothetical protein